MSKQKKTKRDLSFDEKNGHHYRAAKRVQSEKQEKRELKGFRGGHAWLPKPAQSFDYDEEE